MKEKRDRELALVNTGSKADGSNQDWFDGDDDIIDHMVEFESHGSKELGINDADIVETDTSDITSKTDVHQTIDGNHSDVKGIVDKVPQDDDIRMNDATKSDDITTSNDVTMNDHATDSNIANRDDVTNNDDVMMTDNGDDDVITNDESEVMDHDTEDSNVGSNRVCGGHEVAIPIEKAVQQLDMKEEAIETLLCYLELHAKRWSQILKSVRSTCTLKFYGGPAHLHYVAQRVPMVTAALAYARKRGQFKRNTSCLTFPIIEIVDEMGWDLEPVRRELYGLQWNEGLRLASETGLSAGHSGIIVEFTDLAFHVRAPGDLSGDEKDEVCDFPSRLYCGDGCYTPNKVDVGREA
jgi:hypothetical protein